MALDRSCSVVYACVDMLVLCQGNSNDLVRFVAHTLLTFVVFDSSYSILDMYTGISLSRSCVSNARVGGGGGVRVG